MRGTSVASLASLPGRRPRPHSFCAPSLLSMRLNLCCMCCTGIALLRDEWPHLHSFGAASRRGLRCMCSTSIASLLGEWHQTRRSSAACLLGKCRSQLAWRCTRPGRRVALRLGGLCSHSSGGGVGQSHSSSGCVGQSHNSSSCVVQRHSSGGGDGQRRLAC